MSLSDLVFSKIARRDAKREKERSERLTVEIEELQEQLSWARREYVEYQQRAALNARQLQGEIQVSATIDIFTINIISIFSIQISKSVPNKFCSHIYYLKQDKMLNHTT